MFGWIVFVVLLLVLAVYTAVLFHFYYRLASRDHNGIPEDPSLYTNGKKAYIEGYLKARSILEHKDHEMIEIVSDDGLKLQGKLYRRFPNNKKVVIAFHGLHAGAIYDMGRFTPMYERMGCDYLLISERSHEQSEGKYISYGYFEKNDGIEWCRQIVLRYGSDVKILLHGVSMGAATVMMMSADPRLPSQVKAVIEDCGYTDMEGVTANYLTELPQWFRKVVLRGLSLITILTAGYNPAKVRPIDAVKQARVPVLFIHGEDDKLVPFSMNEPLYEACTSPKQRFTVKGAGHVGSFVKDPEGYEKTVRDFSGRYYDSSTKTML